MGARANEALDDLTDIDCNANQVYADTGDAAAAAALDAQGFECTALLNKGQLGAQSTFEKVGELWFRRDPNNIQVLQVRIILFNGANTPISGDAKVCLDDDIDPINDIEQGGETPDFCEGGAAPQTFPQLANNGPSYPPAKAANVAPEEDPDKFEITIDSLVQTPTDPDGAGPGGTVGGFNVNTDGYTEVLPHFNLGGFSIVAYFQADLEQPPDLEIDKTPDGGTIVAGQPAEFTIAVTNNGPGTAQGVTLTDTLPNPGNVLTWQITSLEKNGNPVTIGDFCTLTGNDLSCNFGDMADDDEFVVVLTANDTLDLCEAAPGGGVVLDNGASTGSDPSDDAIANAINHAPVNDPGDMTVQCPGLNIVKTPDGGTVDAGQPADFTITVSNSGVGVAQGVTLVDTLPNPGGVLTWEIFSLEHDSVAVPEADVGDFCTLSGNDLSCDFGDLDPGEDFEIVLRASDTTDLCVNAQGGGVLLDNGAGTPNDPAGDAIADAINHDPVNDPGDMQVLCPGLQVVKTPDGSEIEAGQPAPFTIVVSNTGTGNAEGVVLQDTLPNPSDLLTWQLISVKKNNVVENPITSCTLVGNNLTCSFGTVEPGDVWEVVVRADDTADLCVDASGAGVLLDNGVGQPGQDGDAVVTSTNHPTVHDSGSMTVQCPVPVTVIKRVNGSTDHNVEFTFTLYDGPRVDNNVIATQTTNSGSNGTTLDFGVLLPGSYTLCETVPAHYSSNLSGSVFIGPGETCVEFTIAADDPPKVFDVNNIPCPDVTPTSNAAADPDPGGVVTIFKEIPANSGPATFTYELTGPNPLGNVIDSDQIDFPAAGGTGSVQLTTPGGLIGSFTVNQQGPAKFVPQDPIVVTITPETECEAEARFPIAQAPPIVRVVKTEQPQDTRRAARGRWTFYLIGPDGASNGTFDPNNPGPTSTERTNAGGNRHKIRFDGLEPGDYRLCEKFVGGWKSNLGRSSGFILPNGDRCVEFSLENDEVAVFRVNNRCPSGSRRVPR